MFWRIHSGIFKDKLSETVAWLHRQGDTVQVVEGYSLQLPDIPIISAPQPALAMTTLQDARMQQGSFKGLCTPWLFYDDTHYAVSQWLPNIEKTIPVLNRSGIFVPYGELSSLAPQLIQALAGNQDKIFIKPDKGHKTFAGFSLSVNDWNDELNYHLSHFKLDPHLLCFLSSHRILHSVEWRFWIVNREIAAYAPYSWDDDLAWAEVPGHIMALARQVADNPWQPDLAYVADIVMDEAGRAYLNELNAASTSGVYDAPIPDLLSALRQICHLEFDGEITL